MRELDFRQKAWSAGLIVLFFVGCELFCLITVMSDLVLPRPSLIFETRTTKFDFLWSVGLPWTMPFFFASFKVAISYGFVGAVLSETVASNGGIGNVMMTASSNFNVPLVFAGLFVLAGLGVALYAIFAVIEARVTGWATRKNDLITT